MESHSSYNYQRAVTPTIESNKDSSNTVRGKTLSYQQQQLRGNSKSTKSSNTMSISSLNDTSRTSSALGINRNATYLSNNQPIYSPTRVLHRGMAAPAGVNMFNSNSSSSELNLQGRSVGQGSSTILNSKFEESMNMLIGDSNNTMSSLSSYSRFDIIPLTEEIPNDGILFARIRNHPESLVVFRTNEERNRNPERLNLDRRLLDVCPILENEHRLRLLNYQNNNIKMIHNIENLHNLIFLDMYNNKLTSLDGPLSTIRGLRVLMAGKNKISTISNLTTLKKLDVLDLHSNDIRVVEGLEGLSELRVLNLAGNRISVVQNLSSLHALTELNLRRNSIDKIYDLDKLPSLQRVFLSHNHINNLLDISCIFNIKMLLELSLDGNPISDNAGGMASNDLFRYKIILSINTLRYLDLKRVSDEERIQAHETFSSNSNIQISQSSESMNNYSTVSNDDILSKYDNISRNDDQDKINEFENKDNSNDNNNNINNNNSTNNDNRMRSSLIQNSDEVLLLNNDKPFHSETLFDMARSGRISSMHSVFELEVIGPNEKALVIVGDSWEWISNKRMLANVIELSLCHIDKESIVMKFIDNMSYFTSIRCLRLVDNNVDTLKDLIFISDLFSSTIEEFNIMDNKVAASNSELFKSYLLTKIPMLKSINGIQINNNDKVNAMKIFQPILRMHELQTIGLNSKAQFQSKSMKIQKDVKKLGINSNNNTTANNFDEIQAIEIYTEITLQTIKRRQSRKKYNDAFDKAVKMITNQSIRDMIS